MAPGGDGWNSLEGVAQQEADLATVVALLAVALVAFGPVELRLDLPDAGHLLLLLRVEVRAGQLVSHGFGPAHRGQEHTRRENAKWLVHNTHAKGQADSKV